MKSLSFILFLFLSFFISLNVNVLALEKADLIYKDTKLSAYIINNVSYVSKEDLSYIIGYPVEWDSKERVVIVDNMRIYSKIVIYKGQLLIAIKEVLGALGYQIKWDQATRTITIIPPQSNKKESKANVKLSEKVNKEAEESSKNVKKEEKKYEIPLENNKKNERSDGIALQTVFVPRSAYNEDFKVTVSDLKESKIYKSVYNSQEGYKFVIVSVSQQNLSNKVQLYTGKFVLYDHRNIRYEYIEGLSSYVLQILMPMGINFGTLVFEIPDNSVPSKLVLETYGSTPIVINLL